MSTKTKPAAATNPANKKNQVHLIRDCKGGAITNVTNSTKVISHPGVGMAVQYLQYPLEPPQKENIREHAPLTAARNLTDMTKIAQEYVKTQAAQKLNFAADRAVYQNLEAINVNDSVLDAKCGSSADGKMSKRSQRATLAKEGTKSRGDPEPVLANYLKPVDSLAPPDRVQTIGITGRMDDVFCAPYLHDIQFEDVCEILDRLDAEN